MQQRPSIDRALFTTWVEQHTNALLGYAKARLPDLESSEDVVQLTFISAWETRARFEGSSSPRTWLFAILKHKLADHYRKTYREASKLSGAGQESDSYEQGLFTSGGHWVKEHLPASGPSAFSEESPKEQLDRALHHCLDTLPKNLRSAIEMKYLSEADANEIQDTLGLSAANYWQQVHRAKLKLRQCMESRISPK